MPEGIFPGGPAPFSSMVYKFKNRWQARLEGRYVQVYAGALAREPEQGIIVVLVTAFNFVPIREAAGYYPTPSRSGALHIESVENAVLTLSSANGSTFVFDVTSRQFLDPQTLVPLPALTPSPPPPTAVPTPPPPPIATLAIDTNVSATPSNSATSLGTIEPCGTVAVDGTLNIDVVVAGVPPVVGQLGGITAFQFRLHYDPALVSVPWRSGAMLLAAYPDSAASILADALPDSDGRLFVSAFDGVPSAVESGAGVLARIRLKGLAAGSTALTLSDFQVLDLSNREYPITAVLEARVVIGGACR